MCNYIPGANPPTNQQALWTNCTNQRDQRYPKLIVTGTDMQTKLAIDAYQQIHSRLEFVYLEALEPACFLFYTGMVLLRVCRLTVYDVFAMRTSPIEMLLCIATLFSVGLVFVGLYIDMKSFPSPSEHSKFRDMLIVVYYIIISIRFLSMVFLIHHGSKARELERKILSKEGQFNLSLYSSTTRVIYTRGIGENARANETARSRRLTADNIDIMVVGP